MTSSEITNLVIALLTGAGGVAGYLKFIGNSTIKRPALMSKETKNEFKEVWDKKQSIELCNSKIENINLKLGNMETDICEIKGDTKAILRGINGK